MRSPSYHKGMGKAGTVDLSGPVPLITTPGVMIIPHGSLEIHVSDAATRRLIDDVTEGCPDSDGLAGGSIAVASLPMGQPATEGRGLPRQVVCVCKVVRIRRRGGTLSVLLGGACRARILSILAPDDELPYRRCLVDGLPEDAEGTMGPAIRALCDLLGNSRLSRVGATRLALRMLRDQDVPRAAAVDIAGLMLVRADEARYRLLESPSAGDRAQVVWSELYEMDRLIHRADQQHPEAWPKGMSWN